MTSRARPGISKGLLAQLIALVRADEAGSVGDETEIVDLGGIAAAAVAERVPAALAAGVDIQFARRKASLPSERTGVALTYDVVDADDHSSSRSRYRRSTWE